MPYTETAPSKSIFNETPFFDIQKSAALYDDFRQLFGVDEARIKITPILKGDFKSIGWEGSGTSAPHEFKYHVLPGDAPKLVFETDFYSASGNAKDLLDCFGGSSKNIRRGREFEAAKQYHPRLINAKPDTTTVWVSPKKENWEDSALDFYTQTQINVAEKQSDGSIQMRQFQTSELDTNLAIATLNQLAGYEVTPVNTHLDQVLTSVGQRQGRLSTAEIQTIVNLIAGRPIMVDSPEKEDLYLRTNKLSEINARKLVDALEQGVRGPKLKELHDQLISNTFNHPYSNKLRSTIRGPLPTSCGFIGGGNSKSEIKGIFGEKWSYHNGDCIICAEKNTKVGPCNICQDCEKTF